MKKKSNYSFNFLISINFPEEVPPGGKKEMEEEHSLKTTKKGKGGGGRERRGKCHLLRRCSSFTVQE